MSGARNFHLADLGLHFLPCPLSLHTQNTIMGHRGFDQQRVNIQWEDVGPGELSGDEAMSVSFLGVLGCYLQEVVHRADGDLVGRELADVEEDLELVVVEVDF